MHVISNYLVNALTHKFRANFMNIEAATGEKSSRARFWKKKMSPGLQVK